MDFKSMKDDLLKEVNKIKEKTLNYKDQKSRSMGLGSLGEPETVFVRKFRWTMRALDLDPHYMKKVEFDFAKKLIHFEAMEVVFPGSKDIQIQAWLESDLSKETLVFTTYDGCGKPLYQYNFSHLEVVSDKANFDYSVSDESTRNVTLSYKDYERVFHAGPEKPVVVKKGYDWRLRLAGDFVGVEYDVKVEARPTLEIEETEINFLNSKTWIPGKAHWTDITFTFDRQHDMELLSTLVKGTKPVTLLLAMYSRGDSKLLETWELQGAKLISTSQVEDKFTIKVRYDSVRYHAAPKEGDKNEHGRSGNDQPKPRGECQPAGQVCSCEGGKTGLV